MSVPDYRSERSPSPEGSGSAKAAWDDFHYRIALDLTEEAFSIKPSRSARELPEEARDELLEAVIEEAELLGFWLAWQRAGGFAHLEGAGWNRATIFRKIRRFRATFGVHPDDYRPDWIDLDLHRAWETSMRRRIEPDPEPDW